MSRELRRQEIGTILQKARNRSGLSGTEVAARLGIHERRYYHCENGESSFYVEDVSAFEEVTGDKELRKKIAEPYELSPPNGADGNNLKSVEEELLDVTEAQGRWIRKYRRACRDGIISRIELNSLLGHGEDLIFQAREVLEATICKANGGVSDGTIQRT